MKSSSALRYRTSPRRFPRIFSNLVAAFAVSAALLAAPGEAIANPKYAAIVVDAKTGKTLFARHADAKRFPASLTKMMTLYVLFEELDAGRVSLETRLAVSAKAAKQPPSKLGLRTGTSIRVEDAIKGLVTKSANDVAVVVAEHVSGSVPAFAGRMNRTARILGMRKTTFRNPHGLPNSGQVTTARDMILLARALQDRFPGYYNYFSTRSFTYRGAQYRNHNRLLGSVSGVDGIKTGYTRASGFNLVTNVKRDRRHIIAVVMGGKTSKSRNAHMRDLIGRHLPKASRGRTSLPPLIADTGAARFVAAARLPKPRPASETEAAPLLAYAAAQPRDLVAVAMAEAAATTEVKPAPAVVAEPDPIAERISAANQVAALAAASADPIARLTELARIRAGKQDIIASPGRAQVQMVAQGSGEAGWHIQIGAVATQEGAEALIVKAQNSMGTLLAPHNPLTQEIDHRGTTLYRARFAGFDGKDQARATCAKLKRKAFSCLAVPN